jgi:hypothetical protein
MVKKNTNKKIEKKITMGQIFDKDDVETKIYRDIFRYWIIKLKTSSSEFNVEDFTILNTDFTLWELSNWLLDNNNEVVNEFRGSTMTKSQRAHSKLTYITHKLKKLEELEILVKYDDKIDSKRNKNLKTEVFDMTNFGFLNVLVHELKNQKENNNNLEFRKISRYLLKHLLKYIPSSYKDPDNYYYYILEKVLENSIGNHDNIVWGFYKFMLQHDDGNDINFSELRFILNIEFYKEIIVNKEFKNLFYNIVEGNNLNYYIKYYSELNENFKQMFKEMIKYQFKLDIEKHYDIIQSNSIKSENYDEDISFHIDNMYIDLNNFTFLSKDTKFNFVIKNNWEQIRNMNLSKFNIITIIKKCDRCNMIYPYLFEIEKETYNDIICKYCKNNLNTNIEDKTNLN